MVHHKGSTLPKHVVPDVEGGAERCAAIVGGWLDEHPLERRALANLTVHHAIHATSTREAKLLAASLLMQSVQHMEDSFLKDGLKRGSDRFVSRRERLAEPPRRSQ